MPNFALAKSLSNQLLRGNLLAELAEQLAQPRLQSLIGKLIPLNLTFDPAFHGHGPPTIVMSASNARTQESD